jgi:hypothetical protein
LLKLKIGEKAELKEIHERFINNGFKLSQVGMELVAENDLDLSSDIEFYNYVSYQNNKYLVRVDFDITKYDFDWWNWGIQINDVNVKKLKKGLK